MIDQWEISVGRSFTNDTNVRLNKMMYPFKFLTFWYRPLFEISSIKVFFASLENVFLIGATISLFSKRFLAWFRGIHISIKMALGGAIAVSLFMCMVSSNFGYAMRQRSTILPFICLIFTSYWLSLANPLQER